MILNLTSSRVLTSNSHSQKLGGDSFHSPGVWWLAKKVGSELVRLAVGNYSAIKSGLSIFPPDSSFRPSPFRSVIFRPLPKSTDRGNAPSSLLLSWAEGRRRTGSSCLSETGKLNRKLGAELWCLRCPLGLDERWCPWNVGKPGRQYGGRLVPRRDTS